MKEKMKIMWRKYNGDYRHYICTFISLFMILFCVFYFKYSFGRFGECFVNFGTTMKFYFSQLFRLNLQGRLTITELTNMPFRLPFGLPATWEEFQLKFGNYWTKFFSWDMFNAYLVSVNRILLVVSQGLILVMPIILIFFIAINFKKKKKDFEYNADSKPLIKYKVFELKVLNPICRWFKDFFHFVNGSFYKKLWIAILLFQFNIVSIIFDGISYYFYFFSSFDKTSLYTQFIRLLMDLSVLIDFFPTVIWILIFYVLLCKIRSYFGIKKLEHMERKDRGFINERPIVTMLCGTMGSKKTTFITDIALSQEVMLRDKALEKLLEHDLKYPNFPFILFENEIKKTMSKHVIYNLATARKWLMKKKRKFVKNPCNENIFNYDYMRYNTSYDNNLYIEEIWDSLENYVQLYFIYVIQSSLLLSNYSIRTDNEFLTKGNFPKWKSSFFKKKSGIPSKRAHILDFDALRLGKRIIEDNINADSFEFGVVNITEVGKERGNAVELQQVKKNDSVTNQKNDLFNSWLKMVRHSATVDNYPFVKVICDEQRPESLGADARELAEIVYIDECSDLKLAMPLFGIEYFILNFIIKKFSKRYIDYRYDHPDNTLTMHLYHRFIAFLNKILVRTINQYGFFKVNCKVEKGTMDEGYKESNYYLMFKKIYSKRFSTDCFSNFFNEKALRSKVGLDDLPAFAGEKASFDEMLKENSYFFNDLVKIKDQDKSK